MLNWIQTITNYILSSITRNKYIISVSLIISSSYYFSINKKNFFDIAMIFISSYAGCDIIHTIYILLKNKRYSEKINRESLDEEMRNVNDYINRVLSAKERAIIWECMNKKNEGVYIAKPYNGELNNNRNLYYCQNSSKYEYQIKLKEEFYNLLKYMDDNNKFIFSREAKVSKDKNPFNEYYGNISIKN